MILWVMRSKWSERRRDTATMIYFCRRLIYISPAHLCLSNRRRWLLTSVWDRWSDRDLWILAANWIRNKRKKITCVTKCYMPEAKCFRQDSSENNLFLKTAVRLWYYGLSKNILREIMASYSRWYQILSTVGRIYRNSSWLLMEVNSVQAATQTAEPQAFIYTASCH